jgi:hypothetical protein
MNRLLRVFFVLTLMSGLPTTTALANAPGPAASPQADSASVEVALTVVHAKQAEGGVAPELASLGKQLTKAFPSYKSFVRLSEKTDTLPSGGDARVTLPNQTTLVYRHLGWKDGFATLALEVGGMKSTVNVKDGRMFFQAGRAFDGGMIVLAFKVERVR